MRSFYWIVAVGALSFVIAGCGGGGGTPVPPGTQSIVVNFGVPPATPTAIAVQTGTGPFTPASLAGGTLTVTLPPGTNKYSIAYLCGGVAGITTERIIEATTQDMTSYSQACIRTPFSGSLGIASGSVDASAIAGTAGVHIAGGDFGANVTGASGSFSTFMPTGQVDVAALALDSSNPIGGNVLGVKIVRSQTVPGMVNGGNPIVFAPSDATIQQSLTFNNVQAGFLAALQSAKYVTANGTSLGLNAGLSGQYSTVPASASQPGDFYSYSALATNVSGQEINMIQTTPGSGIASSVALPDPLFFSAPTPAAFPTFTLNYTNFNGMPSVAYEASLTWETSSSLGGISVIATASFQNGSNTVTIPNLTSIPGFSISPPSGVLIFWDARVQGATVPGYSFLPALTPISANNSALTVSNVGSFTLP